MPGCTVDDCFSNAVCHIGRELNIFLRIKTFDLENFIFTVCLGIHAANDFSFVQQGKGKIPVLTFCSRGVRLDHEIEIEQLACAHPIPYDRIERRKEGGVIRL